MSSLLSIESAANLLCGRFAKKQFVQTDLAISYRYFRRISKHERPTPPALIRRLDKVARERGEILRLQIPELPSPITLGLKSPLNLPSLN
jgi:hypothetical protein